MRPTIWNQYVFEGAVGYGALNVLLLVSTLFAVFAVIMLSLPYYASVELNLVLLFSCFAPLHFFSALATGWFVARGSVLQRIKLQPIESNLPSLAGFGAVCGALAVILGQLPLVILLCASPQMKDPVFYWLTLLVLVGFGALGGALYYWVRGKREANSIVELQSRTLD